MIFSPPYILVGHVLKSLMFLRDECSLAFVFFLQTVPAFVTLMEVLSLFGEYLKESTLEIFFFLLLPAWN